MTTLTVTSVLEETVAGFKLLAEMSGTPYAGSFYEWVLDHGQAMNGDRVDIELGEPQDCFRNAGTIALEHGNWRYCEGYALTKTVPIPILHGWLINDEGDLADPTWGLNGHSYHGVIFEESEYGAAVYGSEHYNVIEWVANYLPRADPWIQEALQRFERESS